MMRILVVEDEHRLANSIKKGLEQERYAVDVAHDGEAGWDMAAGEEYDLVILDLMLPKKDGLTIAREMRRTGKHTPILVLTAKGQVRDKVEGLDSGADDYLTKPFSFEELLARIRALVRRPKTFVGKELVVGNLRLDPVGFRVERAGAEIQLSAKEFSLLEYLIRQEGRVVSKEQIIQHVWDFDADVLPNTVEVNIGNLRRKIDKNSNKGLIKTVRGFGYRISDK